MGGQENGEFVYANVHSYDNVKRMEPAIRKEKERTRIRTGFGHSNIQIPQTNTSPARQRNLSRQHERRAVTSVSPDGGAPRNRSQRVTNQHMDAAGQNPRPAPGQRRESSPADSTQSNVVVIGSVGRTLFMPLNVRDRETYIRCIAFVERGLVVGDMFNRGSDVV